MKRILVTGANGDISNAIGRILREVFPQCTLHGADAAGPWPGMEIFSVVHPFPLARDPAFIETFVRLAQDYDLVIPMPEPELMVLAASWERVKHLPLLMNRPEIVGSFCDKWATAAWFARHGIAFPATALLSQARELPLPLFAKPRFGYGSRQLFRLETDAALQRCLDELPGEEFVVQSYLPEGQGEFTCALAVASKAVRMIVLRRQLQGGLTSQAVVERQGAIETLLEQVALKVGAPCFLNVQLRLTPEGPQIFEINPRFSSTVRMRHLVGFQDLFWMIGNLDGQPLPPFQPVAGTRIFRLSRELVVPP